MSLSTPSLIHLLLRHFDVALFHMHVLPRKCMRYSKDFDQEREAAEIRDSHFKCRGCTRERQSISKREINEGDLSSREGR